MTFPVIRQVRASVIRGGGADYHDQQGTHWIDDHIATPMSRYPEYRQSRRSFGINVLGAPAADKVVPKFHPQLTGEPVPVNRRLKLPDHPGLGVGLNRGIALHRPYNH